jgi:hypothetical protein
MKNAKKKANKKAEEDERGNAQPGGSQTLGRREANSGRTTRARVRA